MHLSLPKEFTAKEKVSSKQKHFYQKFVKYETN
mgnify:CR=1 FL=1